MMHHGKSHHCTLIFKVNCYADPKPKARTYKYDKGDYDKLRNIVSQYDNENIENVTCEEAWECGKVRNEYSHPTNKPVK